MQLNRFGVFAPLPTLVRVLLGPGKGDAVYFRVNTGGSSKSTKSVALYGKPISYRLMRFEKSYPQGPTYLEDDEFPLSNYPFLEGILTEATVPTVYQSFAVKHTIVRSLNYVLNGLEKCGYRLVLYDSNNKCYVMYRL